jgi:hypothetical protein
MGAMSICEPWLTRADVCTDSDTPASIVNAAIASATAWLYDATCSQFTGVCTSVIRPTLGCSDGDDCDTRAQRHRVDLSPYVTGPVRSVESVVVDGVELANVDGADYRLSGNRWLVAHEGGALRPWPVQRLDRPDGAEGTWSVTVTHGRPVPPHVADAAADLARQFIAKCTGGECLLPDNATSVSRDGVTVELNVPTDGKTGLPLVDTVVAMYPCRRTRRMWDPAQPDAEVVRVD